MSVDRTKLLEMSRAATSHATQSGSISFGAPVSASAMLKTIEHFKSRDIVKTLKFKNAKQLSDFASRKIARSDLDKQTQIALSTHAREIALALNVDTNKFWTRKLATCAYIVHVERKTNARKRARKNDVVVETSEAVVA